MSSQNQSNQPNKCPACGVYNDIGVKVLDDCWHCQAVRLADEQIVRIKERFEQMVDDLGERI